jgi:hypothetical protein
LPSFGPPKARRLPPIVIVLAARRRALPGTAVFATVLAALACMVAPAAGRASAGAFEVSLTPATQYGTSHAVPRLQPGFVGVSMEYCELLPGFVEDQIARQAPAAASPVLANLLAGLAPGQRPVLRFGGDSADHGYWAPGARAARRLRDCPYRPFALGPPIIGAVSALARSLDAHVILGLNMKAHQLSLAATEAAALARALDPPPLSGDLVDALEIGNEPDLYPLYSTRGGFDRYLTDFGAWTAVARAASSDPGATVAGPSLGRLGLPWISGAGAANWGRFLGSQASPRLLTFHSYPLIKHDCPGALCPSIANLLSESSSHGLAEQLAPFVAATPPPAQVRVDEMNSVTGEGVRGVSDTFASALWALDTLFELEAAGVSGVNVQTIQGARYALFDNLGGGAWAVRPEYYGLLTFALASPPGSQLLSVAGALPAVKVWATSSADGQTRIVIINKDHRRHRLMLYGAATGAQSFSIERLLAPRNAASSNCPPPYATTGICATHGITLGSRGFGPPASGTTTGDQTATGMLRLPLATQVGACPPRGPETNCVLPGPDTAIAVTVPAASAAVISAR